jgi:uncharacterized protein YbjT (DUF2867 family)
VNPVFITGGTGYLGGALIQALLARGCRVHALVRPESRHKLPPGALSVCGDALDATTFAAAVPANATFVHLIGTPHPNPAKAAEFRRVDLASIKAAVAAARQRAVQHFVYVSVAHPAPVMQAYIAVREEGEMLVRMSGIRATILRPWYILGPGHWWPYWLAPVYAILRRLPATREAAGRLGLVTRQAMIAALVRAIDRPPSEMLKIVEVPEIQRGLAASSRAGAPHSGP